MGSNLSEPRGRGSSVALGDLDICGRGARGGGGGGGNSVHGWWVLWCPSWACLRLDAAGTTCVAASEPGSPVGTRLVRLLPVLWLMTVLADCSDACVKTSEESNSFYRGSEACSSFHYCSFCAGIFVKGCGGMP